MSVRLATADDALAIAEVHVSSWHTTYAGLVPDSVIAARTVERRFAYWSEILARTDSRTATYVSVDSETGRVVGFAQASYTRNHLAGYDGEITSIYLLATHQRQGRGRELLRVCSQLLREKGCHKLMLWVVVGNIPALTFYQSLGGTVVDERFERLMDTELHEYAVGWPSLDTLISR